MLILISIIAFFTGLGLGLCIIYIIEEIKNAPFINDDLTETPDSKVQNGANWRK